VVPLLIVSPHFHSLFFVFKQTSSVKEDLFFSSVKLKEEKLKGVFVLSSRGFSTYDHQVLLPLLVFTYNFLNSIDVGVEPFQIQESYRRGGKKSTRMVESA
jgi:membrane protein insertase Oxa1/YidC/SpoIIIJ